MSGPLDDLATRIHIHLTRFEADPDINAERIVGKHNIGRPYYGANAVRLGNRVSITYVTYQGCDNITRAEAERYLAWLDSGHVGKHFQAFPRAR